MLRFAEPHIYTPTDDSLVLWISSRGRGVGSKVFDLSKKGNHGIIYGATWVNIPIGHSALSFDGVDDYILVQDDESLDITDEITIEAWVYFQGGEVWPRLIDKYPAPSIYFKSDDGSVGWYGGIGGVSRDFRFEEGVIVATPNTWTHVVVTHNKDVPGPKVYINGEFKGARSYIGELSTTTKNLRIGNNNTMDRSFNGLIDEVRIYNRALSEEEISERYNLTKHLYGY